MIMEYCVRNSGLEFGAPSFMMNILPLENRLFSVKHEVKKKKKKGFELREIWGLREQNPFLTPTDHLGSLIS